MPENLRIALYDGSDYELRAALLLHNQVMSQTSYLSDDLNDYNIEELGFLLPALKVVADSGLPIALLPEVEYHGRIASCYTNRVRVVISCEPIAEDVFKTEFDKLRTAGLVHNPQYSFGVYVLMLTPTMYHPDTFVPMKGLMIRNFKYQLENE